VDGRLRNALACYAFSLLGIFLAVVPWTPVWREAAQALAPQPAAGWLASGWVRGAASAIGILDLVAAVQFGRALWGAAKKKAAPGTPPAGP
jgi:hypothetical protein